MRKIALLAITLAILVSFSHAADPVPCANNTDNTTCTPCSGKNGETAIEGVTGGVANCGACTINAEKKLTCTACVANYFFETKAKEKCLECQPGCNGGNCENSNLDAPPAQAELTKCISCVGAFFLDTTDNVCSACTSGCKSCSSKTACSACTKDTDFLVRPDTGACVAACADTKGQGVTQTGAKLCSDYAAPNAATVADFNASNTTLSIASLCSPSSKEDATKKLELVGAIVSITLDEAPKDIDVLAIRKTIQTQTNTSDENFNKQNTIYRTPRTTWINIAGNELGTAILSDRLPRGNSTVNWVCVNTYNVKSALKSVKVNFNGTLNPSVKFGVSLNRTLNDTELNNLTCNVAAALFPNDMASYALVKNNKNLSCSQAAKRVLQAAAAAGYGDYSFEVAANQNDDGFAAAVKGKLEAVKTAVSNFAKNNNASVVSDAAAIDTPAGVNLAVPALGVSATSSNDNITVVVNTTSAATVYWALVLKDNVTAADDDLLRGTSARALKRGKFDVLANSNKTSVIDKLNASTSYDIWVGASNWYDPSVKAAAKKYTVTTTGSSFSSLLTLGSMILLVLALFI